MCPHTLLKEGHGVKWPDSHQFIMEKSWWTASWREEVNFESTAEREATEAHIQQWLRENEAEEEEGHVATLIALITLLCIT